MVTLKYLLLMILASNANEIKGENEACNKDIQDKYCNAWYGGDLHTGCKYCGIGSQCPSRTPSGRKLNDKPELQKEILDRHNLYREEVRQGHTNLPASKCLPVLRWDDELAEVAQVWADQCAGVIYVHSNDAYPKIYHEKGFERTTSRYHSPPGVGQNIAWALTKEVNFTRIIDDLWYRDVTNILPGHINEFEAGNKDATLLTQMIWGKTTHVGCGWTQFPITDSIKNGGWGIEKYRHLYAKAEYENFFVCNYGVGGNVPGEPVYITDCTNAEEVATEVNGYSMSNVRYTERYENSTMEAKNEINDCLVALKCLSSVSFDRCDEKAEVCLLISQNTDSSDASENDERDLRYIINTVYSLYFENVWNNREMIQILECNVELLLCSLPNISPTSKVDQVCIEGLEECVLREDALPATKTVTIQKTTIPPLFDKTTTPSTPETTTTLPMIGSTGIDIIVESTTVSSSPSGKPLQLIDDDSSSAARPIKVKDDSTMKVPKEDKLPDIKTVPLPDSVTTSPLNETTTTLTLDIQTTLPINGRNDTAFPITSERPFHSIDDVSVASTLTSLKVEDDLAMTSPKEDALSGSKIVPTSKTTISQPQDETTITTSAPKTKNPFPINSSTGVITEVSKIVAPTQTEKPFNIIDDSITFTPRPIEDDSTTTVHMEDALPDVKSVPTLKSTTPLPLHETTIKSLTPKINTTLPTSGSKPVSRPDLDPAMTEPQVEEMIDDGKINMDISFYNSTSKTSFRLAVCLAGIQCNEDNPRCQLIFQKCNEGINVTNLPFKVKRKLSECSVSDLLCNLDGMKDDDCESNYLNCVLIVVPEEYSTGLFSMSKVEEEISTQNPIQEIFDLVMEKGLGAGIVTESDQIVNLTSAVLGAIGDTFNGIEIEPIDDQNLPAILNYSDPSTVPIFNEITLLLNDTKDNGNEMTLLVGDDTFQLDLTNSTAIFNPNNLVVGEGANLTILRENILKALEGEAVICQGEGKCSGTEVETGSNIVVDSNEEASNSLQFELAICLNGAECGDDMCNKAQMHCIGEDAFSKTSKEVRKELSACYVDSYVCLLRNLNSQDVCQAEFDECVQSSAGGEETDDVVSSIIDQVADELVKVYPESEDVKLEIQIASLNDLPRHFQIVTQENGEEKTISVKIAPEMIESTTTFVGSNNTFLTIDKKAKSRVKSALRSLLERILSGNSINDNGGNKEVEEGSKKDKLSVNKETIDNAINNIVDLQDVKEASQPNEATSSITISKPLDINPTNINKQEAVESIKDAVAEGVKDVMDIFPIKSQKPIKIKVEVKKSPDIQKPSIEISKNSENGDVTTKITLSGSKDTASSVKITLDQPTDIIESIKDAIDEDKEIVQKDFPPTKGSPSVSIPIPISKDDAPETINSDIRDAVKAGIGAITTKNNGAHPVTEVKINVLKNPDLKAPSVTVQVQKDSSLEADVALPSNDKQKENSSTTIPVETQQVEKGSEKVKLSVNEETLADAINNLVDVQEVKEASQTNEATPPITISKPLDINPTNINKQEAVDSIKDAVAEGVKDVMDIFPIKSQKPINVKVEVIKSPDIQKPSLEISKNSENGDVTTKVTLSGSKDTASSVKITLDQPTDIIESIKDAIDEVKEIVQKDFPATTGSPSVSIPIPISKDDAPDIINSEIRDAVKAGIGAITTKNNGVHPVTEVKINVLKNPDLKAPSVTVQVQKDSSLEADIALPSNDKQKENSSTTIPVETQQVEKGSEKVKLSVNEETLADAINNLVDVQEVKEASQTNEATPPITISKPLDINPTNINKQEAIDSIKDAVVEGVKDVMDIFPIKSQKPINVKVEVIKSPDIQKPSLEISKNSENGDVTTKITLSGSKDTASSVKITLDQPSDIIESIKDAIDEVKEIVQKDFPPTKGSPSVSIPIPISKDDAPETINSEIRDAVKAGIGAITTKNNGVHPVTEVKINVLKNPDLKAPSVTVQVQKDSSLEADIALPSNDKQKENSSTTIPVETQQVEKGSEKVKLSVNEETLTDAINNLVDVQDVKEASQTNEATPPITISKPLDINHTNINKQEAVDSIKDAVVEGVKDVMDFFPIESQKPINIKVEVIKSPDIQKPNLEISKNSENGDVTTKVTLSGSKDTASSVKITLDQPSDIIESIKDAIDEVKEIVQKDFPATIGSPSVSIPIPISQDDAPDTINSEIRDAVKAGIGAITTKNNGTHPVTEVKINVLKNPDLKTPSVTVQVQKDSSLEADIALPSNDKQKENSSTTIPVVTQQVEKGNEKVKLSVNEETLTDAINNLVDVQDVKEASQPNEAAPPITISKPLDINPTNINKQEAVDSIKDAVVEGVEDVMGIFPIESLKPINVKVEVTKSPDIQKPNLEISKNSENGDVTTKVTLSGSKDMTSSVKITLDQPSDITESIKDAIDEVKEIVQEDFPAAEWSPSVSIPIPISQEDEVQTLVQTINNKIEDAVKAGMVSIKDNNEGKDFPPYTEVKINFQKTQNAVEPLVTVQKQEDNNLKANIILPSKNDDKLSSATILVENRLVDGQVKVSVDEDALNQLIVSLLEVEDDKKEGIDITAMTKLESPLPNVEDSEDAVNSIKNAILDDIKVIIKMSPNSIGAIKIKTAKDEGLSEPILATEKKLEEDTIMTELRFPKGEIVEKSVSVDIKQGDLEDQEFLKDLEDALKQIVPNEIMVTSLPELGISVSEGSQFSDIDKLSLDGNDTEESTTTSQAVSSVSSIDITSFPEFGFTISVVDDSVSTTESTTTTATSPFGSNLLSSIRDVLIALGTAAMVANFQLPISPFARQDDQDEGDTSFIPIVRDPTIRQKLEEHNATFDGTELRFKTPLREIKKSKVELDNGKGIVQTITDLVVSAFNQESNEKVEPNQNVAVEIKEENGFGNILIRPGIRPRPAFVPTVSPKPAVTRASTVTIDSSTSNFIQDNLTPAIITTLKTPSDDLVDQDITIKSVVQEKTGDPSGNKVIDPFTLEPISISTLTTTTEGHNLQKRPEDFSSTSVESTQSGVISFESKVAEESSPSPSTAKTTTSNRPNDRFNEIFNENPVVKPKPPSISIESLNIPTNVPAILVIGNVPTSILEGYPGNEIETASVVEQEAPAIASSAEGSLFENGGLDLIPGQGSSADIVQATVVEDFNYARSVRDSSNTTSIGIATISSIAVGVIALLAFGLIIFLAIARRRRKSQEEETLTSSPPNATPSMQSRTTYSPTFGGIDSLSTSGYEETAPQSFTSALSDSFPPSTGVQDPVLPIDGHQTIISTYNEFMSLPNESRSDIMDSLPIQSSEQTRVQRTQNLTERSNYLFSPLNGDRV